MVTGQDYTENQENLAVANLETQSAHYCYFSHHQTAIPEASTREGVDFLCLYFFGGQKEVLVSHMHLYIDFIHLAAFEPPNVITISPMYVRYILF